MWIKILGNHEWHGFESSIGTWNDDYDGRMFLHIVGTSNGEINNKNGH